MEWWHFGSGYRFCGSTTKNKKNKTSIPRLEWTEIIDMKDENQEQIEFNVDGNKKRKLTKKEISDGLYKWEVVPISELKNVRWLRKDGNHTVLKTKKGKWF